MRQAGPPVTPKLTGQLPGMEGVRSLAGEDWTVVEVYWFKRGSGRMKVEKGGLTKARLAFQKVTGVGLSGGALQT